MRLRFIVAALCVSSCFGGLPRVVRRYPEQPSPYAPTNTVVQAERGGVVRFAEFDRASANASLRDDAYKLMHDECGGPYKTVNEWASDGYRFIDFPCQK